MLDGYSARIALSAVEYGTVVWVGGLSVANGSGKRVSGTGPWPDAGPSARALLTAISFLPNQKHRGTVAEAAEQVILERTGLS